MRVTDRVLWPVFDRVRLSIVIAAMLAILGGAVSILDPSHLGAVLIGVPFGVLIRTVFSSHRRLAFVRREAEVWFGAYLRGLGVP